MLGDSKKKKNKKGVVIARRAKRFLYASSFNAT